MMMHLLFFLKIFSLVFCVVFGNFVYKINRTFTVEAGKSECFFKNLHRNDIMNIKYMVIGAERDDLTISFRLSAPEPGAVARGLARFGAPPPPPPRRVDVVSEQRRAAAGHELRANVSGEYRFCFNNRFDETSYKTIYLNLHTYTSPQQNMTFTVCGSRLNESLNLVKSVLIFTKTPVRFVVFTERELKPELYKQLVLWRVLTSRQLTFELHDVMYPETHKEYWMRMLPKCSAHKLFVPEVLPHIDALLYVDTDTLFLGAADELWAALADFGEQRATALVPEHDAVSRQWAWYPRFAQHPFYGDFGLNAGVMLMNLTRLRAFHWTEQVVSTMTTWKQFLRRGSQDIINIVLASHPKLVLELSCRFNVRAGALCPEALGGIVLLHGNRGVFHGYDNRFFQAVYRAMDSYAVGSDPRTTFLPALRALVSNVTQHAKTLSPLLRGLHSAFFQVPLQTLLNIDHNKPMK